MADSNSFLDAKEILPKLRKQIFKEMSLLGHENVCCVYSLELLPWGNSNEYSQYTIFLKDRKRHQLYYLYLPSGLVLCLILSGSKYPCLESLKLVCNLQILLKLLHSFSF